MILRPVPTQLQAWWQHTGSALLLAIVLLLVLGATFALVTRTPWTLDQPTQPYPWAIVP